MTSLRTFASFALRLAFCGAVAACLCSCSRETPDEPEAKPSAPSATIPAVAPRVKPAKASAAPRPVRTARPARPVRPAPVDIDDRTDLTAEDKAFLKAIDKAMEDEDYKSLRALAAAASKSPNKEVRSELVDALGWFGEKSMAELTPLMADPDPDIADSALDNWTSALNEIESDETKCVLVEGVMSALKNPDMLESLVMELNGVDDSRVVQTLVNLIGGDNPEAAKAAREHYEFMTGDEYTTFEAAEKWVRENKDEE